MLAELRAVVWRTIASFALLEVMLALAILFWPQFEKNVEMLEGMAPLDMLKRIVADVADQGVSAYVNAQHFFKACNTFGSFAAVLFAMGAVAGEAHRGTLEIWLARPMSRRRMLTQRWIAGAVAVVVPVLATTATVPWLLTFVNEEVELGPLFLCAAHQSLFLLAVYAATFAYSCASSRPWQIAFVMIGFTLTEFSLYMVQSVTHWSLYRLSDMEIYTRISLARELPLSIVLALLAFVVVAFETSQRVFARRVP